MRKQPVTRRHFLGSGIAAAGALTIGGALPANARDWEEYSARFDRSISDGLPTGPMRPDDEAAWKAVAKTYDVTNKITNLENGYWGINLWIMLDALTAPVSQVATWVEDTRSEGEACGRASPALLLERL